MSVIGQLRSSRNFTLTKTFSGDTISVARNYARSLDWANGAGPNQVNLQYDDAASLADAGTLNLDFSGTLVDALGVTLAAARIKYFFMFNGSAAQTLTLGGHATAPAGLWFADAASDKEIIQPGGWTEHVAPTAAGWPITATTADILKIVNSAGAVCPYVLYAAGSLT